MFCTKKVVINNYCIIRPQSDNEQGINKLWPK